jgi:phosphoribosylformylglycinamidine (FGAM) synthase-like amidotransferase family enzyme
MRKPRALVLTGYGINTDYETAHAFCLPTVGGEGVRVHLNDLIAAPQMLRDYQMLAIPGGFSFGDDIASGKVLAVKLRARLLEPLRAFVDRGRLVLGICNGFQVLVKLGLLPNLAGECQQDVTLTFNDSGRFEDRWVYLTVNPASKCVFTMGMDRVYLPVRRRLRCHWPRLRTHAPSGGLPALHQPSALDPRTGATGGNGGAGLSQRRHLRQ